MLTSLTEAITAGVSGVITPITTTVPTAFDNLFVSGDGITNFAQVSLYFVGFGISVALGRWLAAKVG